MLNQIRKKTNVRYPTNTTLIVQCTLNTIYTPDEWEMLLTEVRKRLREHGFREIFIYDTVSEYSGTL